jgi:hypothetical protein
MKAKAEAQFHKAELCFPQDCVHFPQSLKDKNDSWPDVRSVTKSLHIANAFVSWPGKLKT